MGMVLQKKQNSLKVGLIPYISIMKLELSKDLNKFSIIVRTRKDSKKWCPSYPESLTLNKSLINCFCFQC